MIARVIAQQPGLFVHGAAEHMYDRGAILSPDGVHRYRLWDIWDSDLAPVAFVMLNPSTADATRDDPTIRKCRGFAYRWGCGGFVVVNLFAYRATDPADLLRDGVLWDIVGPDADAHIRAALAVCDPVILAWGAHGASRYHAERVREVLALVRDHAPECLGLTAGGQPCHPLMLSYKTPRVPFVASNG